MPIVAGYEFDYTDAGMDKAERLRELEIEVRNADDELFRIAGKEGKNFAEEENRIKAKKARLKKQMSAITEGMKRKPDVEFE
jgi:hypothetical protein|tara:strand:+ start:2888 stop:3133 length:246 start_codon:yes stop_codon:yes gene_type:complete